VKLESPLPGSAQYAAADTSGGGEPYPLFRSGSAIVAYVDGGARGNPGPAGYGVRIEDESGRLIDEFNGFLGTATNNVAEYRGLVAALEYAQNHGHRLVRIRSDSELLVKQMRGEYRVKNAGLQPLFQQARTIAAGLDRIVFEHVRREQNTDADRLANLAMDLGTKTPNTRD
jgi:ribonuclease HI